MLTKNERGISPHKKDTCHYPLTTTNCSRFLSRVKNLVFNRSTCVGNGSCMSDSEYERFYRGHGRGQESLVVKETGGYCI